MFCLQKSLDILLRIRYVYVCRGEDDNPTTFVLAKVHFARGEYDDALEWCAKTVAFADKDDEDIEMYQTKLREVTTKIKDTVDE